MNAISNCCFPLPLATFLLVGCVLGAPLALADEPVRTETVKYSDLNVDAPEGIRALFGRIHAAAKKVCDRHESDPFSGALEQACYRQAETDAIGRMNLPRLTAFYNDKGKGRAHNPQLVAAR